MTIVLLLLILAGIAVVFYRRNHRWKRREATRALLGRVERGKARGVRARPGKTMLVPTEQMPMREQWPLAEDLSRSGCIQIEPETDSEVCIRITRRGTQELARLTKEGA